MNAADAPLAYPVLSAKPPKICAVIRCIEQIRASNMYSVKKKVFDGMLFLDSHGALWRAKHVTVAGGRGRFGGWTVFGREVWVDLDIEREGDLELGAALKLIDTCIDGQNDYWEEADSPVEVKARLRAAQDIASLILLYEQELTPTSGA